MTSLGSDSNVKYLIKSFPTQKAEIVERNHIGFSRTTPEYTVYTEVQFEAQFDDDVCVSMTVNIIHQRYILLNRMTVKMQF